MAYRHALWTILCVSLSAVAAPSTHKAGTDIEPPFKKITVALAGLSTTDFAIGGLSSDADLTLFRKGITAMHGFWLYHAERIFRQLIVTNPKHPLPPAFAAYTQIVFDSGNVDRGNRYMADARQKQSVYPGELTKREVAWIDAIGALYELSRGDKADRQKDHVTALEDLVQTYDDDYEAKAFLALALWVWDISPAVEPFWERDRKAFLLQGDVNFTDAEKKKRASIDAAQARADGLITTVLSKYPNHPAHHYKIHLWNYPGENHLALDSAKRCGSANPSVAHLHHMSAHIFYGVGECVNAAWQVEASQRVDNKYFEDTLIHPEQIHNYAHNFDYLMIGRIVSGGISDLKDLIKAALATPRIDKNAYLSDRAVYHATKGMEAYELWEEFIDLYENAYFAGVHYSTDDDLHSAEDVTELAGIQRMYILSLYNTALANKDPKQWDKAEAAFASWRDMGLLVHDAIKAEDRDKALAYLETVFSNLSLSREVAFAKKDDGIARGEIPEETITKLEATNGFSTTSALLALESGYSTLALDFVAKSQKVNGYEHTFPRTALFRSLIAAHVYHETGDKEKAYEVIAKACMNHDHKRFPQNQQLLARMTWLGDRLKACKPRQGQLDYMVATDLNQLGQLTYTWPDAPKSYLEKFPLGDMRGELLIFSLGKSCPVCNEQLSALPGLEAALARVGVKVKVLSAADDNADDKTKAEPKKNPNQEWFEAFRAIDEFTNEPVHGIFLIDSNGKMRFHHLSVHALTDLTFLGMETERLMRLPSTALD